MKRKSWKQFAMIAFVLVSAYFINVEIQTYLGEKTLRESGLVIYELNQALSKAEAESKWILADVSAIWCPKCRKLDKNVFSDKDVQKVLNKSFVFARIEYESNEGVAFQKKHRIRGFPNLLILNAKGELVKKLPLAFEPKAFISLLEQAVL